MRPPRTHRSPPPSLTAKSARTVSGCSVASHDMPKSSPTSSSAVRASSTSPGGRTPSRASEANATAAAATCPFMSSAPRPQISPSTRSPDHGSRRHSSGSASTVSVCAISRMRRPVPARQARHEVRAVGRLRDELARDAVLRQVSLQQRGGAGLVPRRVDGVETQERPEELRHLVPERHPDSAFDRAVSSFRTSHSSGKTTVCTSLPSTSTGVPCVPTTPSPITRATTR